mmetsp:Transcript_5333/g.9780  ORF Transcript_5333/g.9780 Transcript_5333/m.9780 type:complete len:105 (+) Transcript_5333:264-578(+)
MADFEEPLCGCCTDLLSCLIAWCVPCGTCGISAYSVDKAAGDGMFIPFLLPCLIGCIGFAINRGKIREKYKLNGSFIIDCLLHWFCNLCAVTQEYREVRKREAH